MSAPSPLAPGLADPVLDGQAVFLAVLKALAEPGTRQSCLGLAAAPLPPVMAAIALTFLDHETPYALAGFEDTATIGNYLRFHARAEPAATPGEAVFVFAAGPDCLPPLDSLSPGTPEFPDRSATVVVDAGHFGEGLAVQLSGPGIAGTRSFAASRLDAAFWRLAQRNAAAFPLGVDFIFAGAGEAAGLPRSTAIELGSA